MMTPTKAPLVTRRLLPAVVMALVLMLPAGAPQAEPGQDGSWELGIFGGYAWLDDYSGFDPEDDLILGVRGSYLISTAWSFDTSLQQIATNNADNDTLDIDASSLRFNILRSFRDGETLRPFWTIGAGAERFSADDAGGTTDVGLNVGGGLKMYAGKHFGGRWDVRYVLTDVGLPVHSTAKNVETTFGVFFAFGGAPPPDTDHDGVADRHDKCPDTPGGARVDLTGCPIDGDGDGVFDGIDECPGTAKGWPVNPDGCPKDSDGDGVPDGADECVDTPAGAKVNEKGCPSDADGDGVFDGLDRCPDTPKGATVDKLGCPKDSDHDKVWDGIDQCPDTDLRVEADEKGCPIVKLAPPIFAPGETKVILKGVSFETDSAEIKPESTATLNEVAQSLVDHPGARIQIGGYTDSTGSQAHNLSLSQRRAESVKAYLVARGVAGDRLVAVGYGESGPIADNATAEGKATNRRVELKLLEEPPAAKP